MSAPANLRVRYRYHSLEDFLTANMLSVDGQLDDGWGATFPVKGRELEATVLFADITRFSARTADLTPTETLAFVNHFFAWITAEALGGRPGIVDKYIGDEIMIVFSKMFGSQDPFLDAVQTAHAMAAHDAWSFGPHIGIASGRVIVGYVGTPLKYNCSVFGAPVALAARCAATKPALDKPHGSWMTFPASEWGGRIFDEVFPPERWREPDGTTTECMQKWVITEPREVAMKNLPSQTVRHVVNRAVHLPSLSPEQRARASIERLCEIGRCLPAQPSAEPDARPRDDGAVDEDGTST